MRNPKIIFIVLKYNYYYNVIDKKSNMDLKKITDNVSFLISIVNIFYCKI